MLDVHFGESVADNLARLAPRRIDIPCLVSKERWEVPADHVRRLMALACFEHPERIMVEPKYVFDDRRDRESGTEKDQ